MLLIFYHWLDFWPLANKLYTNIQTHTTLSAENTFVKHFGEMEVACFDGDNTNGAA